MKRQVSLVVGVVVLFALVLVGTLALISSRQSASASQGASLSQSTFTPEQIETMRAESETEEAENAAEAAPEGTEEASEDTDDAFTSMPRYITVVGQGRTQVTPDIAIVNLGVETKAEKIADATDENDALMGAILAAVADSGVEEKDIQTSNYNIYFDEGFRGPEMGAPEPVYRVSNMVVVTIRDIAAVSDILDAVIEAGANRIYGVSFTVESWTEAESEARVKAMANARARAQELAGLASVELGPVISVSEVVGGAPMYPNMGVEYAMGLGGGGAPIAPGQLEFAANLQVTYAIR